jgi:hypothetical protein
MPALLALGTIVAGFIVGGILIGVGHVFIGIIVACGAIPAALAVWITAGDRI